MQNRFILTPSHIGEALPGLEQLARPGWLVNNPTWPAGSPPARMTAIYKSIAGYVAEAVRAHHRPVSIAGDCCAAMGVLAGLQQAGVEPHLLWFDAHGDFNTWETSPSGYVGGMPLAMIVGQGDLTLPRSIGLRVLPEDQVILTDGRDLDAGERASITASKIVHHPRAQNLLEGPLPGGPLHIHFDTDMVSLEESPAHNYPSPGGPPADVIRSVFSRLARSGRVAAVSLSAWNPGLDHDKKSEKISMSLLRALIE
jgi:arginase